MTSFHQGIAAAEEGILPLDKIQAMLPILDFSKL